MDVNVEPVDPRKARKRRRNKEEWKRTKEKAKRYSPKDLPEAPTCGHNSKKLRCSTLTMLDMKKFHENFFKTKNKAYQDAILLKYCVCKKTKRRRPRTNMRKPSEWHTRLFVKRHNSVKVVPVCQKTFLKILHISAHRIKSVTKAFAATGAILKEKRGGDRATVKNRPKLTAVKNFIESFHCLESHYCRSSVLRKYLPSTLNIKKMWRLYNLQATDDVKVKECYFRNIFNTCYNLGFGTPRTDTCSKCSELDQKIKSAKDASEKNDAMIKKRVHTLKARSFYRLLKEVKDGMLTLTFDCQKNQVLPKIPDQASYYSRQLYIYNFAIVQSVPNNTLNKHNVFLYAWTEDKYRKGANEIASAVHHRLRNTCLDNINKIRLVADGCGAQNKNSIMLGMCATWLSTEAPEHVKNIEMVFPVPGHSFLPPDRVFGQIEKEIKNMEVIISPQEYKEVFKNYGTVNDFNTDMDWKSALNKVIRPPGNWHFDFNPCKRYFLKKTTRNNVLVRGEVHYTIDIGAFKSILKKKKSFVDVRPTRIEKNKVILKKKKVSDVVNLLEKHFGKEWRSRSDLSYYDEIVKRAETNTAEEETEEIEDICEAPVADTDLII